ncbi:TIGR03936 family radical SAM-associated protein [Mesotoga prima]|uniref:TIGR03936 family radical SAM-associated protein n=1 Tax=Mesotoga prima TaxID=1184387 RepID=UPI002CB803AB|nr:TIGR03936 family radical SAM-associated protein [Mesotoga prima]HQN60593.1 TIGR03936 family radical SAM-associated protein [Mesotoga prima]
MNNNKLVVRFCCGGFLRFLSHQESATAIERTIKRSGLPVAYTQGFHPRIKISFSPALPTGVMSLANYVLLETDGLSQDVVNLLNSVSNFTIRALKAWYLPRDYAKIDDLLDSYRTAIILPKGSYYPERFDASAIVTKKTKSGYKKYNAGEVFMDLSVTSLRTVHVVKYSQPIESMVTAEEILKILSKEGTASYEGVIVFVEDGMVNGRSTSDILDEIGGI